MTTSPTAATPLGGAATPGGDGRPAPPPHAGRLVADRLRAGGVDTIWTLPGGHIVELLDGCAEAGLRVVDTRHEGSASLAALGWALATGGTGVAAVTAGPGFTNALTGLADAALGNAPLLLIGGRTVLKRRHRGAVQDVDQLAMAAPIVKWAAAAQDAGSVERLTDQSLHLARSGRPGAVYLEVPHDVFMTRTGPAGGTAGFPTEPSHPAASPAELERALAALRRAERPIAVLGSGAFWAGAGAEVEAMAEALRVPLVTTSAARGLVGDSTEWCLGSLVHAGVAVAQADCVLVLGSAFNANLVYGGPPLFSDEQVMIQVDIAAEGLGGNRRPDVWVQGDVARVCADLAAAGAPGRDGRDWLRQARELTALSRPMWDDQVDRWSGALVHPGALCREVCDWARSTFAGAATLVLDGGDSLTWGLAYAGAERPGHLLSTTTALGTLGVGVPFALAAKLARPTEPVVLLTGDGALGLSAMELDTAVRHRLPIVVVVANNGGWGDVRHHQRAAVGRETASRLAVTRYDRLAVALGGRGERVDTLEGVRPALERALASGETAVVDVPTDPDVLSALLRAMMSIGIM
jgi:acetolactate synthase-1/2/3 large subunit